MTVIRSSLQLETQGNCDVIDISGQLADLVGGGDINDGVAVVFCQSSTSALTTIEYEPGCIEDLKQFFETILPSDASYQHNLRWGDGNGYSHLRAALLGASLTIPFESHRLTLGTWQQVVLVDFDNRPRKRELVVQLIGD